MNAALAPSRPEKTLVGGKREIGAILEALRSGECCRFIGPRYHQKSLIMRAACGQLGQLEDQAALYVNVEDTSTTSAEAFYSSIHDLVRRKAFRYYHRRLGKQVLHSSAELKLFLTDLPIELRANIALFIDDLELAPAEYVSELLLALRAAYQMTTTGLRLSAVVCASNGLARTSLGPTSPFENISRLVMVGDLDRGETYARVRQLLGLHCPQPTRRALKFIYAQTNGDRFLVDELARECFKLTGRQHRGRITRQVAGIARDHWIEHGGSRATAEGLKYVETDPESLRALLKLLREGTVPVAELQLDTVHPPDPLITSGFITLEAGRYQIKSQLHWALLDKHLGPEQVGRSFFAAGDWEDAIEYFSRDTRHDAFEMHERVMLPALNAMYGVESKREAYRYLRIGLERAYPEVKIKLYDLDPAKNALVEVSHIEQSDSLRPSRIRMTTTQRPEVKALKNPQDYWLRAVGRLRQTLFIPIRIAFEEPLGLAAIENLVTPRNARHRHGQILELVGYVHHAARALKNRQVYEHLNGVNAWRAKNLKHLLSLTHKLMGARGQFPEILDQVVRRALEALGHHAQMGSVYLYDRETGTLKRQADTGYHHDVRAAAQFRPGEGFAGHVFSTGRTYIVQNTKFDRYYSSLPSRVRSSIGVPLLGSRGPLGVLCLDNLRRANAFGKEDQELLELFAGPVALWLENMRLLEVQQNSRESALLASRLLHQMTSGVSLVPELVDELVGAAENANVAMVAAPATELRELAQEMSYFGGWLDKYVRVGRLDLEQVDVPQVVCEVIEHIERERPEHVQVTLEPVGRVLAVRADPTLIGILCENLLRNAYDALGDRVTGQVRVETQIEGDYCVIRIRDNGPSIPVDLRAKIWEPGWTTKEDLAGHFARGLGLPLSRQIAAAHEGTLTLDEGSGKLGACFVVRLPLAGPRSLFED